jgi:hypothetical protein
VFGVSAGVMAEVFSREKFLMPPPLMDEGIVSGDLHGAFGDLESGKPASVGNVTCGDVCGSGYRVGGLSSSIGSEADTGLHTSGDRVGEVSSSVGSVVGKGLHTFGDRVGPYPSAETQRVGTCSYLEIEKEGGILCCRSYCERRQQGCQRKSLRVSGETVAWRVTFGARGARFCCRKRKRLSWRR